MEIIIKFLSQHLEWWLILIWSGGENVFGHWWFWVWWMGEYSGDWIKYQFKHSIMETKNVRDYFDKKWSFTDKWLHAPSYLFPSKLVLLLVECTQWAIILALLIFVMSWCPFLAQASKIFRLPQSKSWSMPRLCCVHCLGGNKIYPGTKMKNMWYLIYLNKSVLTLLSLLDPKCWWKHSWHIPCFVVLCSSFAIHNFSVWRIFPKDWWLAAKKLSHFQKSWIGSSGSNYFLKLINFKTRLPGQ